MRGLVGKRFALAMLATAMAVAGVAVTTTGVAAASTRVTGAGRVHCDTTGKAIFAAKPAATANPKTKLKIVAALTCTTGETGNSAVTVIAGKLVATVGPLTASCASTNLGAASATIAWKATGGSVTTTKLTFASTTITDGTNITLDVAGPGAPPTGNPGSYVGETVALHIVGDATPGGLCAGAKIIPFTGTGGASTFDLSIANPHNLPIQHVVVLMQENRSADHYLGRLNAQGQSDYEAEPTTGNPDPTNPSNPPIVPFHETSYCGVADLDHSWNGTHHEVDGGAMDGFTTQNVVAADPTGHRALGYYDQTDLPYYYALDNTFSTGDRYFSSVLSQTYPNRLYLLAGTSFGHIRNDAFALTGTSIFELLDAHSISWKIYSENYPGSYAAGFFAYVQAHAATHIFPMSQYYTDLANNTLPDVSYVDSKEQGGARHEDDEHPVADVQLGQKFVADVTNALMASSSWGTSAMFFTYDEHGGFYDHVVPPAAVPPDNIPPMLASGDVPGAFDQYGVRVPATVISPYSKAHHVSHVVDDHTSILKFIEYRFGLSSLTNRDAVADPMLDHFDFSAPTFATPPSLPTAVVDPTQLAACPGP